MAACDWGWCDELAEGWRFDEGYGWLPVCVGHGPVELELAA